MSSSLRVARRIFFEASKDELVKDFIANLMDIERNVEINSSFEKLMREMGFGNSLRKVNFIGSRKLIAYFGDDEEARRLYDEMRRILKDTKVRTTYKDLDVGRSKAGLIFDFTKI